MILQRKRQLNVNILSTFKSKDNLLVIFLQNKTLQYYVFIGPLAIISSNMASHLITNPRKSGGCFMSNS